MISKTRTLQLHKQVEWLKIDLENSYALDDITQPGWSKWYRVKEIK